MRDSTLLLVDTRPLVDDALAPFMQWLGAGESGRMQRFVRHGRRRQFLIGRVLARQALGLLLGADPRHLALEGAPDAKPFLSGEHPFVDFSISHSGYWVACAASVVTRLGLDIESIDPARDVLSLAEHAFAEPEVAWLKARPDESRTRDFYHLWSASEARIKLGAEGACCHFQHDELAIALCCTDTLTPAPALVLHSILS